MLNKKDAFMIAEDCARNKDDLTQKRWAIQAELEKLGFDYYSKKGGAIKKRHIFPAKKVKVRNECDFSEKRKTQSLKGSDISAGGDRLLA